MKHILPALLAVSAVCIGYISYGSIAGGLGDNVDVAEPAPSFDEAKTDFISVAVFSEGKVHGYLSFRVAFSISDAQRAPEVGYLASDVAIRKKISVSDIDGKLPAVSKMLEKDIKTHVEGKLPPELVKSVRLADFGFDARI